ncbi:GFA family protein [Consotaella salsifontis]|uniref:Uncharacterized conserved protein n=1 Tax=Consotaella salsifontis TaxID=1365950 RepID=A0A1T4PS15_9HYPH|nr:GFA family protein [Consotaella salsifontis]SJZ94219.1 Uncharacterized conserved protein [Consotaella salsifontis]
MMGENFQEGGCRCGQVRFRVRGRPMITLACHCTGCQKMSSSAFSLSALYGKENFELISGEPVLGGLRGELKHFFCPSCMSWMFTRLDSLGPFVNIRPTMLDDASGFRPFAETYTCEAMPWAKTTAVRSFEKFPEMEQMPALLAEFAESDF